MQATPFNQTPVFYSKTSSLQALGVVRVLLNAGVTALAGSSASPVKTTTLVPVRNGAGRGTCGGAGSGGAGIRLSGQGFGDQCGGGRGNGGGLGGRAGDFNLAVGSAGDLYRSGSRGRCGSMLDSCGGSDSGGGGGGGG